MSNPFDYVNEILLNKKQLIIDSETESKYIPFIINRSLSYHKDCVLYANEMNIRRGVDNKLQNDFYLNIIRSYKRPYAKWIKKSKNEDIEYIKEYFGYSYKKALDILNLLSEKQLNEIKEKINKGGLINERCK